ncbi:MAG: septation protein A [Planctomycetota bacterium]
MTDAPPTDAAQSDRALSPRLKFAVEMGPLLVFFATFLFAKRNLGDEQGVIWATGLFVAATLVAVVVSYSVERRVHPMTLVTGAVVLVMGTLTVALGDERFIKYKPTLVSGLMGSTLLVGHLAGKSLVKPLLGSALELDDEGWRKLTVRWGFFFLLIAGLNEVVWRSTSTSTWVNFKIFGILALTFVFLLLQGPLIQRHQLQADPPDGDGPRGTTP